MTPLERPIKDVMLDFISNRLDSTISLRTSMILNDILEDRMKDSYIIFDNASSKLFYIITGKTEDIISISKNEEGTLYRYTYFISIDGIVYVNENSRVFNRIRPYINKKS